MNCPKCGNQILPNSKFCVKCGQSLIMQSSDEKQGQQPFHETPVQNINNVSNQTENTFQPTPNYSQNNIANVNTNTPESYVSLMSYFFIILAVILKPFTAFKEELNKFKNIKHSAVLTIIVSGVATFVNLLTTIINAVVLKSYDLSTGGYKTTLAFDNLKEINYLQVIGKNFLIYIGIILSIAAVYYMASLIMKKQTNFSRLLGISALAISPMLITSLVLSPLLSLIWDELAMPITLIGAIYSIVILYESINNEIGLNGNTKYYFNSICLSILGIAAYYLYMELYLGSINSELNNIMSLFE